MPFVPAPNIVMCEILAQKDGQLIENRVMVNVGHEPIAADLTALANEFTSWCNVTYKTLLPADVTITGLRLTSLHEENAVQLQTALALVGTVALPAAPNETTYCISLRTGVSGRSARGRFYWLGLALANIGTTNRVGALFRTNSTAGVQSLINQLNSVATPWMIVSYIANGVPRPGGPVYFQVLTATTTDDIVDSQRRRRPGIGS